MRGIQREREREREKERERNRFMKREEKIHKKRVTG